MRRCLLSVVVAALIGGQSFAQVRPSTEVIGSWVLTCPTSTNCTLRHRSWLLPPIGEAPSAALEVVQRGGRAVPAVALHGLSVGAALGGVLLLRTNASIRFDDDSSEMDLPCAPDGGAIMCTPTDAAVADAASELVTSRVVQVRVHPGGGMPLPEISRSLDLQQTSRALARFRATSPVGEAVPAIAGLDLLGLLDRLARDAGFHGGLADLFPSVAGLVGIKRF